jgi:hypothetical protein
MPFVLLPSSLGSGGGGLLGDGLLVEAERGPMFGDLHAAGAKAFTAARDELWAAS